MSSQRPTVSSSKLPPRVILLGRLHFLIESFSRRGGDPEETVWHVVDLEEQTCSCEWAGEFNPPEEKRDCRHQKFGRALLKRIRQLAEACTLKNLFSRN